MLVSPLLMLGGSVLPLLLDLLSTSASCRLLLPLLLAFVENAGDDEEEDEDADDGSSLLTGTCV